MRKLLLSFLFSPMLLFSQSDSHYVIAAQGDSYSSTNISVQWTIGEVFTESVVQSKASLTQGFHQSWLNNHSLVSEDILNQSSDNNNLNSILFDNQSIDFNVYPNPSDGIFNIEIKDAIEQYYFEIYDSSGRVILNNQINQSLSQIDLSSFENGLYNLIIRQKDSDSISATRIIKL